MQLEGQKKELVEEKGKRVCVAYSDDHDDEQNSKSSKDGAF